MAWDVQALFRQHAAALRRALRRRGAAADLADDLAQDAFVRMLAVAAPPRPGATDQEQRAYLFRVSHNLLTDHWRAEGRSPRVDLAPAAMAQVADPAPSPERVVYDRQRLHRTAAALAELPERTRRAFELHRMGEHSIAEVAGMLGLSTTRCWMLVHDAYRHIRQRLHED